MEPNKKYWWNRDDNGGRMCCGCSECDIIYSGRGLHKKLQKHAREAHGERIEVKSRGYGVV